MSLSALALDIPGGRYVVGEDIPAGAYTISIEQSSTNLSVWGAAYQDYDTNGGLLLNVLLSADSNPTLGKVVLEENNVIDFSQSIQMEKYNGLDVSFDEECVVPGGRYIVGEDIPAGSYTISIEQSSANLTVWGAAYHDYDANGGLLLNIFLSKDSNPTLGKVILEENNIIDFTSALVFSPFEGFSFDDEGESEEETDSLGEQPIGEDIATEPETQGSVATRGDSTGFIPVMKGSKGDFVRAIQSRLIELGFLSGSADGDYGNNTEAAVSAFQTESGIEVTGIVDSVTFEALYEGVDGLIDFRGIEWYSTKADAEQILFNEGAETHGVLGSPNDIYRMSGTDYANVTVGSDRVDGGGVRAWYADISVAGYDVDDTYACYVYPVVDGQIVYDDELAELYMGWYTFQPGDYADYEGIYNDLLTKLTSVYGEGDSDADSYFTTTTWIDPQGSQVRLLINDSKNYVCLAYMAYSADERLDAVAQALEDEAVRTEADAREANAYNVDAL